MTDTTQTAWYVDGVSLQNFAWNIETLGGDRMSPPPLRGTNVVVPHRPGALFRPKTPDQKTLSLGMWVVGCDADGNIPASARQQFTRNWRYLRKLLWQPRRQFVLTKKFWVNEDELVDPAFYGTLPSDGHGNRLISASGRAQYAGGLEPSMNGPGRAAFTVDLQMTDPYFYSDQIAFDVPVGALTKWIIGDDRSNHLLVEFNGPLSSGVKLTNTSETSLWVQHNDDIDDGEFVTMNVSDFTSKSGSTSVLSKLQHSGDYFWMYLDPGYAALQLASPGDSGSATIRYNPAWY